ncbi:hypothetical protein [Nocardia brasiliensis]|uniref:hypothetical protein n=1 Tax=Nocardia brasiliensis TaxID=37326 RepID=UPI0018939EB1|nr:hypothetical protein [Nocardia brasiliensis]MBF6128104.1 hypothetical protein [Nocardia brasiliensis]MBF6546556.1 hypothetical protein [Nocardia brasiliensis]
MTTFATLLVVAVLGYLIYHYLPKGAERAFRLERFQPHGPLSDWTASYYDEQRRYADLAAIYGRNDTPETPAEPVRPTVPENTVQLGRAERKLTSVRSEAPTRHPSSAHPTTFDRKAS